MRDAFASTVPHWQILRQMVLDGASPDLLAWALTQGYLYARTLPDGRLVAVMALTFGRARLVVVASAAAAGYDDGW